MQPSPFEFPDDEFFFVVVESPNGLPHIGIHHATWKQFLNVNDIDDDFAGVKKTSWKSLKEAEKDWYGKRQDVPAYYPYEPHSGAKTPWVLVYALKNALSHRDVLEMARLKSLPLFGMQQKMLQ